MKPNVRTKPLGGFLAAIAWTIAAVVAHAVRIDQTAGMHAGGPEFTLTH